MAIHRLPTTTASPAASGAAGRADKRLLSPTMEDYLEAIFVLSREDDDGACGVSAIARALDVKPPSVSKAVKRLQDLGYVEHEPYGKVSVTARGAEVAASQVRTHRVLMHFLTDVLRLPEDLAEHDTCLIEHAISRATIERLVEFIDTLEAAMPEGLPELARFDRHSARHRTAGKRSWTSRV
ncbi:MAG: metal-dependent transcriptional regulator [Planctomycetota bacterium]